MVVALNPIDAVVILDNIGTRIMAKYYNDRPGALDTNKSQLAFEKALFERTKKHPNNEVTMLDNGHVAVYRSNLDVMVYVVGSSHENELMLATVLDTLFDTLAEVLKPQIDKKALLDSFDSVILALDEIVDRGVILETDHREVLAKIAKPTSGGLGDIQLNEQTLSSAFQMAKQQMKTFLR